MLDDDHQYLSHDLAEHRLVLADKARDRARALAIFSAANTGAPWRMRMPADGPVRKAACGEKERRRGRLTTKPTLSGIMTLAGALRVSSQAEGDLGAGMAGHVSCRRHVHDRSIDQFGLAVDPVEIVDRRRAGCRGGCRATLLSVDAASVRSSSGPERQDVPFIPSQALSVWRLHGSDMHARGLVIHAVMRCGSSSRTLSRVRRTATRFNPPRAPPDAAASGAP